MASSAFDTFILVTFIHQTLQLEMMVGNPFRIEWIMNNENGSFFHLVIVTFSIASMLMGFHCLFIHRLVRTHFMCTSIIRQLYDNCSESKSNNLLIVSVEQQIFSSSKLMDDVFSGSLVDEFLFISQNMNEC